jgi:hypothetical protein
MAAPMQFTDKLLEYARRRYENGDPTTEIADALRCSTTTVQRLARRCAWMRPPPLDLNPVMARTQAAMTPWETRAAGAAAPSPAPHDAMAQAAPAAPLQPATGEAAPLDAAAGTRAPDVPEDTEPLSIDRMERTVLRELAAVERTRAGLGAAPQGWIEARETARTLASLTQTLQTLQRMRQATQAHAARQGDYDIPEDIDAFRHALAERIIKFVESRRAMEAAEEAAQQAAEGGPAASTEAAETET